MGLYQKPSAICLMWHPGFIGLLACRFAILDTTDYGMPGNWTISAS
jgi:hypothetical protein